MHRKTIFFLAALALGACARSTTVRKNLPELRTVPRVDLSRYMGTWYELASYPQSFQRDCFASTATYALRGDGQVDVLNTCHKGSPQGPLAEARGRARVVDPATNARLQVSFFGPFWGDYWVIDLAPDYTYAVVGHPSRDYLWILSRTPGLEARTLDGIRERLAAQGYELQRLRWTVQ